MPVPASHAYRVRRGCGKHAAISCHAANHAKLFRRDGAYRLSGRQRTCRLTATEWAMSGGRTGKGLQIVVIHHEVRGKSWGRPRSPIQLCAPPTATAVLGPGRRQGNCGAGSKNKTRGIPDTPEVWSKEVRATPRRKGLREEKKKRETSDARSHAVGVRASRRSEYKHSLPPSASPTHSASCAESKEKATQLDRLNAPLTCRSRNGGPHTVLRQGKSGQK